MVWMSLLDIKNIFKWYQKEILMIFTNEYIMDSFAKYKNVYVMGFYEFLITGALVWLKTSKKGF